MSNRRRFLGFALLVVSLLWFTVGMFMLVENRRVLQQKEVALQQDSITIHPVHTLEAQPEKVPVTIEIPRLHVKASIQPVGLDQEGRMATIPNAQVIAWYAGGVAPGNDGNAILAGHRDWNGVLGTFWRIDTLQPHDVVQIAYAGGSQLDFEVVSDATYPANQVPDQVMQLDGPSRTTLITCGGNFNASQGGYQSRVVVTLQKKEYTTGG